MSGETNSPSLSQNSPSHGWPKNSHVVSPLGFAKTVVNGRVTSNSDVVWGSGPSGAHPHNCCCMRHHGKEQPRLGRTAEAARPDCRSGVKLKHTLQMFITQTCLKLYSSRQTQGVMGTALNRWRELQVRCAASASCSSAEAASSVLSTSPESWIACVGRANSSTQH